MAAHLPAAGALHDQLQRAIAHPGDGRAIGQQRLQRILRQLAAQELALPMAQVQSVPLRARRKEPEHHLTSVLRMALSICSRTKLPMMQCLLHLRLVIGCCCICSIGAGGCRLKHKIAKLSV